VFAAAVAVTGCATQPTSHPTSPTVNPVDRPGPPSVNPPIPDPQLGIWRRFAPAPIPADPAGSYAGVWTGRELLVSAVVFDHRGAIPKGRSVATAYHPATGRWRRLPPAPGQVVNGEGGYHAVWTGRELLGWGMGLHAAYNPASNRWRPIATAPIGAPSITVWTGRQVLRHCCIEPECVGEAQQSGGSPSWKGAEKGSNHSTVPMICRLWAAMWRRRTG
jgi:hypothetical protein